MDKHRIIRVGGRLRRSRLSDECKHPIILPKKSKVTDLTVRWCYYDTAHSERGITLDEISCKGFLVICESSAVKSAIFNCVICCKEEALFSLEVLFIYFLHALVANK